MTISNRQWLLIVICAIIAGLLFGAPVGVRAAGDPAGAPNTLTIISGPNVFVDADGQTMTAFMYRLDPGTPEPSHIVLSMCAPRLADVVGWQDWETTGSTLKLDNLRFDGANPLTFSLVMRGTFTSAPMPYTIKAGQQSISGASWGPTCTPTAVTLSGLSAEDSGQVARNVTLLVLVVVTLLLARWALREGKR